jgi:NAD(P)-dependent dehydrogenase (short-subunit alcohol dehydrogenase family)
VLVYNAALVRRDRLGELSAVQLLGTWAVNVGGAATAAAHTGRKMAAAGHGTLIITGGMPEPLPESFSLSLGKAGVRTLVELLDQELGPSGVHVTTVTVYGAVAPGTAFDPDEIAETYWQLSRQPRKEWTREVAYTGPAAIPRSAAGEPSASGRLSATASGAVSKPAWPRPPWLQHDRQKCIGRAAGIACATARQAGRGRLSSGGGGPSLWCPGQLGRQNGQRQVRVGCCTGGHHR